MTFEDDLPSWRALASERLEDWKAERERRIKAEQELDEARRERDSWRAQVPLADWEKGLIQATEQPRPLTADDFGQMEAAWKAADNDMAPNDGDTLIIWKGRDWWEIGVALPGRPLDRRIARVLRRPPARPEGAEDIERVILDYK